MTRTVADAAILLGAMTGVDPRDSATSAGARGAHADYTTFLDADALKGARIGVARKRYFGYSPAADRLVNAAIAELKARGAVIVDPADIPTAAQLEHCELEVLLYEFKADLNGYLRGLGPSAKVRSLEELIAFNEREKDREMALFGQEILLMAQSKGPLTSPAYRRALATCRTRARTAGIDAVMTSRRLDAIVAPTGSPAWLTDPINGDHYLGSSSTPAAVAGYPSITVPAGFVHGLPAGLSFIGRAWSEPRLLALAYAYEQATRHRRPPQFLPTAQLDRPSSQ
jgi:amidase